MTPGRGHRRALGLCPGGRLPSGLGLQIALLLLLLAGADESRELLDLPAPGIAEIKAAPERPDEPSLYRKPSPRFIRS